MCPREHASAATCIGVAIETALASADSM